MPCISLLSILRERVPTKEGLHSRCSWCELCTDDGRPAARRAHRHMGSTWTPKVCKIMAQNRKKLAQRAVMLHTVGIQADMGDMGDSINRGVMKSTLICDDPLL